MNRRNFTKIGTTVIGLSPFSGFAWSEKPQKPNWLIKLIHLNDSYIKSSLQNQIQDQNHPFYGAIRNGEEIPDAVATSGVLALWAIGIACPESDYYQSTNLLNQFESGAQFLLKAQHRDGTIDLLSSNFHSPPDTAFSVEKIARAYTLLATVPKAEKALIPTKTYLLRAGEALVIGGIHTPNHRWVVTAALLQIHALFPDKRYVTRAEEWLLEHIDIDPDGQYTEKSAGGYTAIVNRVLIDVALGLNKPEILDAVRKNLNMTMYYTHPNGEVVTEASNRQDKGTINFLQGYYYSYRKLAIRDQNPQFAAMCRLIEETAKDRIADNLSAYLLEQDLWKELPNPGKLPTEYVKAFPYSGVVRIRKGNWDATLLSNNPGFLTFQKGKAVLQGMRIAASFFGKGQFQSSSITQQGDSWVLTNALEGPYYQPYPKDKIDPNGNLSNMPRTQRTKSEIQYLRYSTTVTPQENGIQVDFVIEGTDGVPVSLELIFRPGGILSGINPMPGRDKSFLFDSKIAQYTMGEDSIHISPGLQQHKGIVLRGALPPMDAPTVYLTGFTPFKHSIKIY
ncbi:MAG: hypothetical protein RI903_1167 [Bacteroidota bacterium]